MRGKETVGEDTNKDIDLNLSLSLNGRFGVDPQRNHKITVQSSTPNVLVNPHQRRSAERKVWPFFPTSPRVNQMGRGRNEVQSLALMDANRRRSLESSGSSTITYFQNQIIEGNIHPFLHFLSPYLCL